MRQAVVHKPGSDYEFKLGTTYGGMVNIETTSALNNPPSEWTYKLGAERYTAGDGWDYYDGDVQVTWFFPFLKVSAWQWLEGLFSGTNASVNVYIKTKTDDDTYGEFTAVMHKPEIGDTARRGTGGYFDVTIRFTAVEAYSP